jgi:hypothetical protein
VRVETGPGNNLVARRLRGGSIGGRRCDRRRAQGGWRRLKIHWGQAGFQGRRSARRQTGLALRQQRCPTGISSDGNPRTHDSGDWNCAIVLLGESQAVGVRSRPCLQLHPRATVYGCGPQGAAWRSFISWIISSGRNFDAKPSTESLIS